MSSEEIVVKVKQNIQPSNSIVGNNIQQIDPIMRSFFMLDEANISDKDRSKLAEISDFLGELDGEEKVRTLHEINRNLGTAPLGTTNLDKMHRWIRIKNSIKQKENELTALEQ